MVIRPEYFYAISCSKLFARYCQFFCQFFSLSWQLKILFAMAKTQPWTTAIPHMEILAVQLFTVRFYFFAR